MRKMSEPKEIHAQQLAQGVWALIVDGETLEEHFNTAKAAVDFGRDKYGIKPKARMLPKKATTRRALKALHRRKALSPAMRRPMRPLRP